MHEEIRGHCINGWIYLFQDFINHLHFLYSESYRLRYFKIFTAADMQSTKDIKLRLDEAKVVGITCLGITTPLLSAKKFDVCIMDEAGQITLPVCNSFSFCFYSFHFPKY